MTGPSPGAWDQLVRAVASALAGELVPVVREAALPSVAPVRKGESDDPAYLSVGETCKRFQISRATFDRMLSDETNGLESVVVRLPPVTGRVRVPLQAFEAWLRERATKKRRRRE